MAAANRSVTVTLNANVSGLVGGLQRASAAANETGNKIAQVATRNQAEWDKVGNTLLGVGAAIAAGLGLATKAAVDWESQFAGVKKTVDDNAAGYAALSDELRGLARELPASHQEIAATAEAAGQLGVAREDIVGFTRTMIDLGETTNLSADEAATALARFSTITGASYSEVDRLGSTLVGLGNNFAATESEILEMATRLAGMGTVVGLTEADILGLSAAMTAVGINAEAGGTAMSISMSKINDAVLSGSDKLEQFASVAGMTADEFRQAWTDDPAQALTSLVEGLGRVSAEGGNVNQVLRDLGITNQRERDAMLRLAGASDTLRSALALAFDEFSRNSALSDEAALRYETAASRIQVAINNIKDAAITIGSALAPALADAADQIAAFAGWVGQLPPGLLSAAASTAALVGGLALVGGAVMKAVTALAGLKTALATLGVSGAVGGIGGLTGALARVAVPAGIAAAALYAAGTAIEAFRPQAAVRGIDQMTVALERAALGGQQAATALDDMFRTVEGKQIAGGVDSLASAIERFGDPGLADQIANVAETMLGFGQVSSQMERVNQQFDEMDQALAGMASGGSLDEAQKAFSRIRAEWEAQDLPLEKLGQRFSAYRLELERTATSLGVTNLTTQDYISWMSGQVPAAIERAQAAQQGHTGAIDESTGAIDENTSALERNLAAMRASANLALQLSGDQMALEAALDSASDALERNGRTLDIGTEAGRANQQALNDIAGSALNLAESMAEANRPAEEIAAVLERGRDEYIKFAMALNGGNEADAIRRWEELGISVAEYTRAVEQARAETEREKLRIELEADAQAAMRVLEEVDAGFTERLDGRVTMTYLDADGNRATAIISQTESELIEYDGKIYVVTLDADGNPVAKTVQQAQADIDGMRQGGPVMLDADGNPVRQEVVAAQNLIDAMRGKIVNLAANNSEVFAGVRAAQATVDGFRGKSVNIEANPIGLGAMQALQRTIDNIRSKTVTITTRTVGGVAGAVAGRAYGGPLPGHSSHDRADNILFMGTAKEWVIQRPSARYYGDQIMAAINEARIPRRELELLARGALPRYAVGGQLGASSTPAYRSAPPVTVTLPAQQLPAARGGDSNTTITLQLDGREIARAVHAADAREGR